MSKTIVTIHHLCKTYDDGLVPALHDVSFTMERGTIYALTGPSGCGKSTLLHIIGTLDKPDSGELHFSKSLEGDSMAMFRTINIGFIFQFHHLIPILTLRENVETAMLNNPSISPHTRQTKAYDLLQKMQLGEKSNRYANRVSGGERQRGAIARALANDPILLLADEPTGSVDSTTSKMILRQLTSYVREHGATLLVATHDPLVAAIADIRIEMLDGNITNIWRQTQ